MPRVILASASPRRQELLKIITENFRVVIPYIDETMEEGLDPRAAVEELALRKARSIAAAYPGDLIISADTIVLVGDLILGKPSGPREAIRMLGRLSGKDHRVITGVAICQGREKRVFSGVTAVKFLPLSPGDIEDYVATGESRDMAGAYGIQGKGALFVSKIHGDYFNVVGLPVAQLNQELHAMFPDKKDWTEWISPKTV